MDNNRLIILSMHEQDAEIFAKLLKPHAPETLFVHAGTIADVTKYVEAGFKARLLSFCSPNIIPGVLLKKINHNAYNFHPGPPDRPGYRPTSFAALENARTFGVTLHKMTARVDEGDIVDATHFDLEPNMSVEAIEIKAYQALASLFVKHASSLANIDFDLPPSGHQWSGKKTTRKELDARSTLQPQQG